VSHVVLDGHTTMGRGNRFFPFSNVGIEPQDLKYKGEPTRCELGDNNTIRECVTISRGTVGGAGVTKIGSNCLIMAYTHIGHDSQVGNGCILANGTTLAGHVHVEDGVFLGGATVVHQHTRIGRLAISRGGTRLGKDVPPFFMATDTNLVAGINRIGLRRAGFSHDLRRAIQAAFDLLYRSDLNVTQALNEIEQKFRQPEIAHLIAFIRSTKRGICKGERTGRSVDED